MNKYDFIKCIKVLDSLGYDIWSDLIESIINDNKLANVKRIAIISAITDLSKDMSAHPRQVDKNVNKFLDIIENNDWDRLGFNKSLVNITKKERETSVIKHIFDYLILKITEISTTLNDLSHIFADEAKKGNYHIGKTQPKKKE